MPFPVLPDPRHGEPESYFRIQDPFGLRRSVTPVFIRDLHDGMFYGRGTAFFVTPFWHQLSAMHVVTDFFEERGIPVRPGTASVFEAQDARIEILFDPGLVYGTRPAGQTLPVATMVMFPVDQAAHPLASTFTEERLRRVEPELDLIAWDVAAAQTGQKTEFLPVRVGRGPFLGRGDRVMAVGYPKIESKRFPGRAMVTYQEDMFGSVATVTDLNHRSDPDRKLWPGFVVDVGWPSGMSGGPVFNEAGEVIGVVSRGGPDWTRALWLQALPYRPDVFGAIDPDHPGWIRGWGVCNARSLLALFQTREEAEAYAAGMGGTGLEVRFVSTPFGRQLRARPVIPR